MSTDDPFGDDVDIEAEAALRRGRYRVPHPVTGRIGNFTRVTKFVKAIADNFALERWKIERVVEGLASDETLYFLAAGIEDFRSAEGKKRIAEIVEIALERAGANEGSRFGTAMHAFNDNVDRRHPAMHRVPSKLRPKYVALATALRDHRLAVIPEYIERRVFVERFQLVGTLDRILLDEVTGELVIGDLKTQKGLWGFQEISIQLALYANADWMWEPATQTWEPMPEVRKDAALVLWMPRVHPPKDNDAVEVEEVRIARAYEYAAQVCADARAWHREGSKLGMSRPLPNRPAPVL